MLKKKLFFLNQHTSDNIEHIISEKPSEDRNLFQICFRSNSNKQVEESALNNNALHF